MARGCLLAFLLSFGPIVSNSFARFGYALVLPSMRADLDLSWSQAGWLNTTSSAGYLAGAVLTRLLVGRLGNRRLFQAGMLLTALAILATGMTRNVDMLALARLLAGVTGAAVFICGGALSANVVPARPALATTFISIYIGGAGVGMVVSAIVIPFLLEARGHAAWPAAWMLMGWAALAMSLVAIRGVRAIAEPGAAEGSAHWRIRPFLPQAFAYLMFAVGYIGYMTFIVAWMRDNGASTVSVATTWSVLGIGTIIAPLIWRKPLERWRGGHPMAIALALLSVGSVIPLLSAGFGWMLASAALFGVGMFLVPASVTALVRHGLPKPAWGTAMATFTIVFGAGQIVGPVATGWLADLFGSLRPGLAASVALLVVGACAALAQRDVSLRPGTEAPAS